MRSSAATRRSSRLEHDRTTKQRVYANAEIPVYWIVNLRDDAVEVYERPLHAQGRYEVSVRYFAGDDLPLLLDSQRLAVAVSEIL